MTDRTGNGIRMRLVADGSASRDEFDSSDEANERIGAQFSQIGAPGDSEGSVQPFSVTTPTFQPLVSRQEFGGGTQRVENGNVSAMERARLSANKRRKRRFLNPDGDGQFDRQNSVGSLPVVLMFCCFGAILLLIVVFLIVQPTVRFSDKAGCTQRDFDNYQRGYGRDNGSCTLNHRQYLLSVCSSESNNATYYDAGGPDGVHAPVEDTSITFRPAHGNVAVCVRFDLFGVVGGDADCTKAYLQINGSQTNGALDGKYCNERLPTIPQMLVCSELGQDLKFRFVAAYSDEEVVPPESFGWEAHVSCGNPGCTNPYFGNYKAEATVDDLTCEDRHGAADVVEFCTNAVYYDSGGPTGNYATNEFTGRTFKSSDPSKVLCFTFVDFDVICSGDADDDDSGDVGGELGIVNSVFAVDNQRYCNSDPVTINKKICSKPNGAPIQFRFRSDDGLTGAGWKALVTCE